MAYTKFYISKANCTIKAVQYNTVQDIIYSSVHCKDKTNADSAIKSDSVYNEWLYTGFYI